MDAVAPNLSQLRILAGRRLEEALAELRAAALHVGQLEASMANSPSLDQPGFDTSPGRAGPGPKTAEHAREQAAQDEQVKNLADRVSANSTGSVPRPLGR